MCRPGQARLRITSLGLLLPCRSDDRILVFAGLIAHEIPVRQRYAIVLFRRQVGWGLCDVVADAQRIVYLLPEDRWLGHLRLGTQHARIATFLTVLAVGEQQVVAGSGQRHVCQPAFVAMVAATVFLGLREVQGVGIHGSDLAVEGAQRAVDLVVDGFRAVQQFQRLDRVRADRGVMREARQDAGVRSYRDGNRVDFRQP